MGRRQSWLEVPSVSARVRNDVVEAVLDVPADRLASVIGSWPNRRYSRAGPVRRRRRWSILTAMPGLVFKATDNRWWCGE